MRFLQFWILPDTPSLEPSLEQRQFTREDRTDRLLRVSVPRAATSSKVHQDASVHVASLSPGTEVSYAFGEDRGGYLYLIEGSLGLGEDALATGDAAKIFGPEELSLRASIASEFILIDVPTDYEPVGVWAR